MIDVGMYLSNTYRYCGSGKPKDPKAGDIYSDTNGTYLYVGNDRWETLYDTDLTNDHIETAKPKVTICPHCGAPTNGLDRCEYCGGYV